MGKIVLLSAFASAILVTMLPGSPALALNLRSWVSGTGGGTACTRAAPCPDFQTAHDATNPGGEINCVDAGDFTGGGLTIAKSITIDCGGTFGGQTQSTINVDGAGVVVRLRNLSLQGGGSGSGSGPAINFANGAALYVENCTIFGWYGAGNVEASGTGISFAPPDGVTARLYVTNSIINNNGSNASGGGITIHPTGSGSARAMIERSHVEGNTYGIAAEGGASTGVIIVHLKDSVVANNGFDGIAAYTSADSATVSITVDHSSSLLNAASGIYAQGPIAYVVLANSTVMSNGGGLSSAEGGTILSYQNNQLAGNATDGAPTATLGVK